MDQHNRALSHIKFRSVALEEPVAIMRVLAQRIGLPWKIGRAEQPKAFHRCFEVMIDPRITGPELLQGPDADREQIGIADEQVLRLLDRLFLRRKLSLRDGQQIVLHVRPLALLEVGACIFLHQRRAEERGQFTGQHTLPAALGTGDHHTHHATK